MEDTIKDTPAFKIVAPKAKKDQLQVKIYAPFKTYYDGAANSVTATNDTGKFDILPRHHSFITLLNSGSVTVRNDKGEDLIRIERGIMHVNQNNVTVFLDV